MRALIVCIFANSSHLHQRCCACFVLDAPPTSDVICKVCPSISDGRRRRTNLASVRRLGKKPLKRTKLGVGSLMHCATKSTMLDTDTIVGLSHKVEVGHYYGPLRVNVTFFRQWREGEIKPAQLTPPRTATAPDGLHTVLVRARPPARRSTGLGRWSCT